MKKNRLVLMAGASMLLAFAAAIIAPKPTISTREDMAAALQVLDHVAAAPEAEFICWSYEDRNIETTLYFQSTLSSNADRHIALINHHNGRGLFTSFSLAAFDSTDGRFFANHAYGVKLDGDDVLQAREAYAAVMQVIEGRNGIYDVQYQCDSRVGAPTSPAFAKR